MSDTNSVSGTSSAVASVAPATHVVVGPSTTATASTAGNTTQIALGADVASALYGVTGTGLKIGIISDSFNATGGAAADMTAGILPAVTVLSDNGSGTDEGRAMIEIANSVAPGATYYTADGGSLAQNVAALQAAGVNIIVDDLSVGGEALYQIGSDTDVAIQAAVAAGVDYFTSAGNNGNDYYEHGFTPLSTTIAGIGTVVANDFGGGNAFQSLTLGTGDKVGIVFQWAQPFGNDGSGANSPTNSLAIYLLDSSGAVVASSTVDEVGAGNDPTQAITFTNTTAGTAFRLVVVQNGGTVPSGQLFKYFLNDGTGTINDPDAGKGSGDLLGHELLPGINVLGSVPYTATPAYGVSPAVIEGASSVGPGTILFDANGNPLPTPITSGEPQFEATDGTTAGSANTNFASAPFFGTSAAAPAAGAVSALVLQANGALSTAQVTSVLAQSVIPVSGQTGFSGAGLIQARAAVEIAAADAGDRWTTAAGGDWNNAAAWSGGAAPTSAQAASVDDDLGAFTGTYTVTVDTAGDTAGSLAIAAPAGSSATVLVAAGGVLAVGPAGATASAVTATDITSGELLVSDNGTLSVAGGMLSVTGSLNDNNGTVTVSLGSVTANNYSQDAGALVVGGGAGQAMLGLTGTGIAMTGGVASILAMGAVTTTTFAESDASLSIAFGGVFLDNGAAAFTNRAILVDAGVYTTSGATTFLNATVTDSGSLLAGSVGFSQSTFTETGALATGGALTFDDTAASVAAGAVANVGSLGVGSTLTGFTPVLTIGGRVNDAGALGQGFSGTTGTVSLLSGGELDVGGANNQVGITFTGNGLLAYTSTSADTLVNQEGGFITGLAAGNGAVDFTGLAYDARDTLAYNAGTGEVDLLDQTGTDVATVFLATATNYTGLLRAQADAAGHAEIVVACYVRGTRVLTARGEVAVEALRLGDLVVTTLGRGPALKPVTWLGHRSLDLRRQPRPELMRPVRIQSGALGDNQPHRDLLVSPGHRLKIGGTLVCASDLVNGATITQESPDVVEYWHVEVQGHDVLLAEGVEAESYHDTGNRSAFEEGAVTVLHPVLDGDASEPCLPYASADPELRERLALRAEAMGWRRERDPLPWLEANGRRIEPVRKRDRYRFALPANCSVATLHSRAGRPCDSSASVSDSRRLGLLLNHLALCGPEGRLEIGLEHALLGRGFHAVERDEQGWESRWTDGTAVLRLGSLADGQEVTAVEIGIDRDVLFWVAPERVAAAAGDAVGRSALSA